MTLEHDKSALESLRSCFRDVGGEEERGVQAVPFGTPNGTNWYPLNADSDGHLQVDVASTPVGDVPVFSGTASDRDTASGHGATYTLLVANSGSSTSRVAVFNLCDLNCVIGIGANAGAAVDWQDLPRGAFINERLNIESNNLYVKTVAGTSGSGAVRGTLAHE